MEVVQHLYMKIVREIWKHATERFGWMASCLCCRSNLPQRLLSSQHNWKWDLSGLGFNKQWAVSQSRIVVPVFPATLQNVYNILLKIFSRRYVKVIWNDVCKYLRYILPISRKGYLKLKKAVFSYKLHPFGPFHRFNVKTVNLVRFK